MADPPAKRSSSGDIAQFLRRSKNLSTVVSRQARLLFAIDATASRQPTWDSACHLQGEMFRATGSVANLSVQLAYYRGFNDFYASDWLSDTDALGRLMSRVSCEGGHTQIARLLRHAQKAHRERPVRAVVFIGDAVEESVDTLCNLAGECGIAGLPLFLFQEGGLPRVQQCFEQMARLSGGAYARFDAASSARLAELLGAVARYAAGGREALEKHSGEGARMLLRQLKP